ncbi:MAG: hypothetical protein ACI8P2_004974, partial [Candidatus Latescibacterota bacterium]
DIFSPSKVFFHGSRIGYCGVASRVKILDY